MAFASLLAFVALAASARAAAAPTAVCPDGTRVSNSACCAFIPLAKDLQSTLFQNECGEDGEALYFFTSPTKPLTDGAC
jgi:manganese peroxidase